MIPIWDVNPSRRTPFVTIALVAANVLVFLFWQPTALTGATERAEVEFVYEHAMVPCEVTNLDPLSDQLASECGADVENPADSRAYFPGKSVILAVFTSLFLHGGIGHLVGNMWFLMIYGNNVEDRLGHLRYLVFYLLGGVIASIGHIASDPSSVVPVIGASGAIAAVMGAYLVLFPSASVRTVIIPIIWRTFPLFAWFVLLQWFVFQFLTDPAAGVAWIAHVVGFVFGVVAALVAGQILRRAEPSPWPDGFGPN